MAAFQMPQFMRYDSLQMSMTKWSDQTQLHCGGDISCKCIVGVLCSCEDSLQDCSWNDQAAQHTGAVLVIWSKQQQQSKSLGPASLMKAHGMPALPQQSTFCVP